jgi:hypothetical protein
MKVSELVSIEKRNQALMDFLAATAVGKFPHNMSGRARSGRQRAKV